ncbi:MAG TPA: histidine phosphatase family protein [Bellilinea sp.]|nr:histidine phosphatase family protein [Bellilinea sp.]
MLRLFFVRHAESEANVLRVYSNTGWKHPLIALGVVQANSLAKRLLPEGINRIYSSPVMRAVQTSEILSTSLGVPFTVADALREFDVGIYEGKPIEDGKILRKEVETAWFTGQDYSCAMPGGESYLDIRARFIPFINELVRSYRTSDASIVLVSHGGIYFSMLPEILANLTHPQMQKHSFINTGYVLAELQSDDSLKWVSWETDAPSASTK